MGFNTEVFVTPVDRNLLCGICGGVYENPIVTLCGHTYCRECLKRWLCIAPHGRATCPDCRRVVSLSETVRVLALSGVIESLPVKCSNAEKGCLMVLALAEMQSHSKDCGFTPVKCYDCGVMVPRGELADHKIRCNELISNHACAVVMESEESLPSNAEFVALQNELSSVKKSLEISEQNVLRLQCTLRELRTDMRRRSRQQDQEFDPDWDPDYSYGYSPRSVSQLASLISRFLLNKPHYIDCECIFVCLKRCYDYYHKCAAYWQDVFMLLAVAFASSWFTDTQQHELDSWLKNVAREKILP